MDYGAIDLHKKESHVRIVTETGEVLDRRIPTTRDRFTALFWGRSRLRILLEASTESEWVAQHLDEAFASAVINDRAAIGKANEPQRRAGAAGLDQGHFILQTNDSVRAPFGTPAGIVGSRREHVEGRRQPVQESSPLSRGARVRVQADDTRSSTRLAIEWRHPTVGALLQHSSRHQSSSVGQARRDGDHVSPALPDRRATTTLRYSLGITIEASPGRLNRATSARGSLASAGDGSRTRPCPSGISDAY